LIRDTLARWRGREIRTIGDSFFLAFSDPSEAVQWAAEAQRALLRHPWPPDIPMRIRIGMHTGRPHILPQANGELDYWGSPANKAARVTSWAQGVQILVSQVTYEFTRHHLPEEFSWHDLGSRYLKGIGEERLW